jgi:hypothetical protein
MDFDFHKTYAALSNVELLRILLQKELYQPAAIEAAEKILSERNVTSEEKETAANDINEKSLAVQKRQEQREKIIVDTDRTVRSFLFPEKRTTAGFIRYFVFAYAIIWLISMANNYGSLLYYWNYEIIGFALYYTILDVVVPLLMLYGLFRLKKLGWALLIFNFTIKIFSYAWSIITWSPPRFAFLAEPDISIYIIGLVICVMVFYFFNRKLIYSSGFQAPA